MLERLDELWIAHRNKDRRVEKLSLIREELKHYRQNIIGEGRKLTIMRELTGIILSFSRTMRREGELRIDLNATVLVINTLI
jgi:hypothetical protein